MIICDAPPTQQALVLYGVSVPTVITSNLDAAAKLALSVQSCLSWLREYWPQRIPVLLLRLDWAEWSKLGPALSNWEYKKALRKPMTSSDAEDDAS